MSLQAIAGIAYDRRNPSAPSPIAARQALQEVMAGDGVGAPLPVPAAQQVTAKQINGALESLKRYIPTEFLALYLPFLAIAKDRGSATPDISSYLYVGFLVATPLTVYLIYLAKAAEAGRTEAWKTPPVLEAALGTAAFAVWGATVPGMFAGHQWWLGMLAMASAVVLPLIDTALTGKNAE